VSRRPAAISVARRQTISPRPAASTNCNPPRSIVRLPGTPQHARPGDRPMRLATTGTQLSGLPPHVCRERSSRRQKHANGATASVQARSALTVPDVEYGVEVGDLHESADGWGGLTKVEGDRPVPGRIADRDQVPRPAESMKLTSERSSTRSSHALSASAAVAVRRSSSVPARSTSPEIASSAQPGWVWTILMSMARDHPRDRLCGSS